MIRIKEELAGDTIWFHYANSKKDLAEVRDFIRNHSALGMDTESTGLNCYRPQWRLRTVQYGNDLDSYVVPQRFRNFIGWSFRQSVKWIGHNGPHDIRCVDVHLGYDTEVVCAGETYIPAHHLDSRNREEGGVGHGLKELAIAHVDRTAGRWEQRLKEEFKKIVIPIPGEFFKSGPRKGMPKTRKAKISEGWGLIDPTNRAYIAYAAADPLLTYRVWRKLQPIVREFHDLYQFDHRVQIACDRLQRRAIRLDVDYTQRLDEALNKKANSMRTHADLVFGCENVNSGDQIAETLIYYNVKLRTKTASGKWKTDAELLRKLLTKDSTPDAAKEFIRTVLVAKQLEKRRVAYTNAMLRERDSDDRVHPSINSLAARTTRQSVSSPALQQLPTKDHEEDLT